MDSEDLAEFLQDAFKTDRLMWRQGDYMARYHAANGLAAEVIVRVSATASALNGGVDPWQALLSRVGPCVCDPAMHGSCDHTGCVLCIQVPEDWPCPAECSGDGYGPAARASAAVVAERNGMLIDGDVLREQALDSVPRWMTDEAAAEWVDNMLDSCVRGGMHVVHGPQATPRVLPGAEAADGPDGPEGLSRDPSRAAVLEPTDLEPGVA